MKKLQTTILAISLVAAVSASAQVYVLGPSEAANGPLANGSASIDTTSSQAMIGTGAWQANGTAVSQYYFYYNGSSSTELGMGQLTINSLSSLSFSTFNTPAQAGSNPNWYLIIYTTPTGVNDEASWYGHRLILEGLYANNFSNPGNQWVTWSTASGVNQLTINDDGPGTGGNNGPSGNLGFYGAPTLANIQSGPITWSDYTSTGSSTPVAYGNLNILGIVLSTGNPWAVGFTGLVDDVNIDTTQGNAQFDLEPVPEPTTIAMITGGLLVLLFSVRRPRRIGKS